MPAAAKLIIAMLTLLSHTIGGKVEKETDTDSPLDSSGSVGKEFTSDGAIGELWPTSLYTT